MSANDRCKHNDPNYIPRTYKYRIWVTCEGFEPDKLRGSDSREEAEAMFCAEIDAANACAEQEKVNITVELRDELDEAIARLKVSPPKEDETWVS